MNFFKSFKNKIKKIFQGKEKESEIIEEQVIEVVQTEEAANQSEAEAENEIIKENTELENKIKEAIKKIPLRSKVVLLGSAVEKLDNIELSSLIYFVESYSLIISEDKEYLWVNLKNTEDKTVLKLFMILGSEERLLIYEDEYKVGRDKNIEISSGDYVKIVDYKISVLKYIKIKTVKFLSLYYSEILKYKKYYVDSEDNQIISNSGEYIQKFLGERGRNFQYSELQKYFEKELNKKIISKVSHDEKGIFYFDICGERYIKNKYLFKENEKNEYFKADFKTFVSLKSFNEQELSRLSSIEVYENLTGNKKLIFYNEGKKTYIQNMYIMDKNDIMTV